MALVAVLGFIAALSLVLIGVSVASRSTLDAANRHLLRAQAQMAIESAVEHAASTLAGARGTLPSLMTTASLIEVGGFRVRMTVRSERGKVDLNFADQALLAALFRSAGAPQDKADALAAAVEDWRDGDDLVRLNGAEKKHYLDAGLKHVPENKPFRSAGEAQRILGMTPRIFACIVGEITVLTQSPGIEVAHAASALQRELGLVPPTAGAAQQSMPLTAAQPVTPGDVFEITAELEDPQRGIRRGERVSVRITGNPEDPYWIIGVEPLFPIRAGQEQCPAQGRST